MAKTLAESIVDAVLEELRGRSGIGDELDSLDDEIKEELELVLKDIVEEKLQKAKA